VKQQRWVATVIFIVAMMVLVSLSACGKESSPSPAQALGSKPPMPKVIVKELDNATIKVYQSSYCWTTGCADYPRPEMMLKNEKKLTVPANATIVYSFPGKPPSAISLSQFNEDESVEPVIANEGTFQVPGEKGVYYYAISAHWLNETMKDTSDGSSSYVFAVEVKE